jgi:hypothetical protein
MLLVALAMPEGFQVIAASCELRAASLFYRALVRQKKITSSQRDEVKTRSSQLVARSYFKPFARSTR